MSGFRSACTEELAQTGSHVEENPSHYDNVTVRLINIDQNPPLTGRKTGSSLICLYCVFTVSLLCL